MTKTQMIADPNSCLNRAAPNEPVFTLRANDPIAGYIVKIWAETYLRDKGGLSTMTEAQRAKYHQARMLSADMDAWGRS